MRLGVPHAPVLTRALAATALGVSMCPTGSGDVTKPRPDQQELAKRLGLLVAKLNLCYSAPNDADHRFEHTGWLLLRVGAAMVFHGDRAFHLAADWAARGYPSGTIGGGGGGSASWLVDDEAVPVTSTEAAALQSDEWERRRDALSVLRKWLDDNARDIESHIAQTVRVLPNEGRRDSLTPCGNPHGCENAVTGIGSDRLKAGRCPRCYWFRYRHGRDWNSRLEDVETISRD